jgi:hypothetical protein
MVSTMTRRSILKYAAAMGTALVLPGSVAAGHDEQPPPTVVSPVGDAALLQRARDNATYSFRSDFTFVAKSWTRDDLAERVNHPEWASDRGYLLDDIEQDLCHHGEYAAPHARFMIWAMESHAAGYTPEQCWIDFPVVNGRREMSLMTGATV